MSMVPFLLLRSNTVAFANVVDQACLAIDIKS